MFREIELGIVSYPSEKYEFVNWDDDIPNDHGKIKHIPNHQPVMNVPMILSFKLVPSYKVEYSVTCYSLHILRVLPSLFF